MSSYTSLATQSPIFYWRFGESSRAARDIPKIIDRTTFSETRVPDFGRSNRIGAFPERINATTMAAQRVDFSFSQVTMQSNDEFASWGGEQLLTFIEERLGRIEKWIQDQE